MDNEAEATPLHPADKTYGDWYRRTQTGINPSQDEAEMFDKLWREACKNGLASGAEGYTVPSAYAYYAKDIEPPVAPTEQLPDVDQAFWKKLLDTLKTVKRANYNSDIEFKNARRNAFIKHLSGHQQVIPSLGFLASIGLSPTRKALYRHLAPIYRELREEHWDGLTSTERGKIKHIKKKLDLPGPMHYQLGEKGIPDPETQQHLLDLNVKFANALAKEVEKGTAWAQHFKAGADLSKIPEEDRQEFLKNTVRLCAKVWDVHPLPYVKYDATKTNSNASTSHKIPCRITFSPFISSARRSTCMTRSRTK